MEAKHLIFFALAIVGVPIVIALLRSQKNLHKIAFFFAIFMIPFVYSTGINFFTDKFYRGTSRGFEFLAADLIIWALAGFLISKFGWRNFKLLPSGAIFYIWYFAMACISLVNVDSEIYAGYELLRMVNMYIYFVTVYNYLMRFGEIKIILYAFASLLFFNFAYMLFQKYLMFVYQPSGIFPHRNGAAMFANMIAPIFLSIMFNAKVSQKKFWIFGVAYAVAAMLVVVALSRGSLFFFPVAALIVAGTSFWLGSNERKIKLFLVLGVIAVLGILRSAPMIIERFEYAPESSAEGRVQLAKAALNMANDKFFGVGINNWGIKINPPYRYAEGTGMVRPNDDYKSGLVETIYLLVAAECGWLGFAALISWMYYYYIQNALNIIRFKKTNLIYMPVGILGGMTAIYGQSCLEWVLKQPTNFYQLMIIFAIIAAMLDTYKKSLNYKRIKK